MTNLDRVLNLQRALVWISSILAKHRVPFQIVGGTAAFAHGGKRPIVDLDIYAPLGNADELLSEIEPWIIWGPQHYCDTHWDLTFLKIDHSNVRIEIGDTDSHPRYYSSSQQRWIDQAIDYHSSVMLAIFDVLVPVMPVIQLVDYKNALGRPVDLTDIAELGYGTHD